MRKRRLTKIILAADELGINDTPTAHIDRICLIHSGLSSHSGTFSNTNDLADDAIRCYEKIIELLSVKEEKDDSGEGE